MCTRDFTRKSTAGVPNHYWSRKCQDKVCRDISLGHGRYFPSPFRLLLHGPPARIKNGGIFPCMLCTP